jgi:hypothetical protein
MGMDRKDSISKIGKRFNPLSDIILDLSSSILHRAQSDIVHHEYRTERPPMAPEALCFTEAERFLLACSLGNEGQSDRPTEGSSRAIS